MQAKRHSAEGEDHGIDLAPMLDFTINLLIFFIITDLDFLRRYSIMLYPAIGAGIFIAYFTKRRRERRLLKQKADEPVNPEP